MGSCVSALIQRYIQKIILDNYNQTMKEEKNKSHGQNDHSQHEGGQKSTVS